MWRHLSLRMMLSLPGCPARQLVSPDMSERQCSGDVLPGLQVTFASARDVLASLLHADSRYSPACKRNTFFRGVTPIVSAGRQDEL